MKRGFLFTLFLLVACAQIAIPATILVQHERILRNGTQYRFRCGPVDPYDAFRGRYVALKIDDASLEEGASTSFYRAQRVYARIEVDEEGFARLVNASAVRPSQGDYICGRFQAILWPGPWVRLSLPFERYYMDERLAPLTEQAMRLRIPAGEREAYITVRVLRGNAVLEELHIDDQPIREFLRSPKNAP